MVSGLLKLETMKTHLSDNKNVTDYPSHAYILWKTGEVLGFNMKDAARKMDIGSTAFKTNMRNRYVCKFDVIDLINSLKVTQDNECQQCFNSENYNDKSNTD